MNPSLYLPRPLPEPLRDLAEIALDLRWCWNHAADALWQAIDPEMWEATGNPWLIIESVSQRRLEELAKDRRFCTELLDQVKARRDYMDKPTWFSQSPPPTGFGSVAYFSMEFGLSEALPIYSGGLGVLAGDYLKAASDLGIPVLGIGLLYQQGYFRQSLDAGGNQIEFFPVNDPSMLPMLPLRDDSGEWLRVRVELPGRVLRLRAWQVQVGRVRLLLLDSNDPQNLPGDRGITGELYGGGLENRLHQEVALGIGGWRLLRALNIDCPVCHLNEGHAAFAVVERARGFMNDTGLAFAPSLCCTRAGNIFTTHTPLAAGFDRFPSELISQYFHAYAAQLGIPLSDFLALGRAHPEDSREPFNMAYLALRGCGMANGVSRLHGEVSRRLFEPLFPRWPVPDIPVKHVTNGVHVLSWESAAADDLWTIACGIDRWHGNLETLEQDLRQLSDEALWVFRCLGRKALVDALHRRLDLQAAAHGLDDSDAGQPVCQLDPDVLTLGIARRFTSYKRPNLLLYDPERLMRLLTNPDQPAQLIVAGKAHPMDTEGKRLVREWALYVRRPDVRGRVVFVQDYDLALAQELVQGVDLWINTPLRPWEACGTSGMKVLVNGGLNLSELDGWWAEAYAPEVGWALGDGNSYEGNSEWDALEAHQLFSILEKEVVPAFYTCNDKGVPEAWVSRMRESMARLTPRFSTNRMMREYMQHYYLPCAVAYARRIAERGAIGTRLCQWQETLAEHWPGVHFGKLKVQESKAGHLFRVQVYLGGLPPEMVRVELYAEPLGDSAAVRQEMTHGGELTGAAGGYLYSASVPLSRPAEDYTPRIIPSHPEASVPLEEGHILWQR